MPIELIITILVGYFLLLIGVSYLTSRNADTLTFFNAKHSSPWYLVAYGMIGASLSGVTFISVPGEVGNSGFAYMQIVLGYFVGYLVIAFILLPLYYKLKVISIYQYLKERFGEYSYKTGASFFLLSRTIGAAFRLYLMASVLQFILFDAMGIPFYITVITTIFLIWIYTVKGGIKTVVYTDTLQTTFMLVSLFVTILGIASALGYSFSDTLKNVWQSDYSKIFYTNPSDTKFFVRYFLTGVFITIVMTGLDQDMMQKNLTCKNLKDAQKNMLVFSVVLIIVNFFFLILGGVLYLYVQNKGISLDIINNKTDLLFPYIALNEPLSISVGIFFLLGIIAAAYSSADSALTSLTTSASIDLLEIENYDATHQMRLKNRMHLLFSIILFIVIMVFYLLNNDSVIKSLFKAAGFTYGPLLGMYAFGLFTKRKITDKLMPFIAIASPIISFILFINAEKWFNIKIGFEILLYNGFLTFLGMLLISEKSKNK